MLNTKGFGRSVELKKHPIYHEGIDRAVGHILNGIARLQFLFDGKMTIYVTNDIPDDPHERSMGLTPEQIAELKSWLAANRSRLPKNLEVWVLRLEDRPSDGMLWKLNNFTKIMVKI